MAAIVPNTLKADELESVSDYIAQVLKFDLKLKDNDSPFASEQRAKLDGLHKEVNSFVELVLKFADDTSNEELRSQINAASEGITETVRELRSEHWGNLSQTKYSPLISTCYTDTIHSYRKIKNHLVNVTEALAGEK